VVTGKEALAAFGLGALGLLGVLAALVPASILFGVGFVIGFVLTGNPLAGILGGGMLTVVVGAIILQGL
jgi:hypothetical protein